MPSGLRCQLARRSRATTQPFGVALALALGAAACTPEAGRFSLSFVWEDGPPERSYAICSRLEPSDGSSAIALAPARYEPATGDILLDVPEVPHGRPYAVVVDAAADCAGSRIEYHGSAPILLEQGASFSRAEPVLLERTPHGAGFEIPSAIGGDEGSAPRVATPLVDLQLWPEKTTRVQVALDQQFSVGQVERPLASLEGNENPRIWADWNLCGPASVGGAALPCEDGVKQVWVRFLNDADLPSETYERVLSLDTRAPSLDQLSVEPAVARAGSELVVRLTANEPLAACPELAVKGDISFTGCGESSAVMVEPQRCEYCASIGADLAQGSYPFSGRLRDRVGHESESFSGVIEIDQTEPALQTPAALRTQSGAAIDGQVLVRAGEALLISFRVEEPLAVPARVIVEGEPAECDPPIVDAATGAETYNCRLIARAGSGDGPRSVLAVLQDLAGHTSRIDLGSVMFDVDLPTAVNTSLVREPAYAPALGNGRVEFSATDPFTGDPVSARITVFASKTPEVLPELRVAPLVLGACRLDVASGPALAFQRCNAAGCPADPRVLEYVHTFSASDSEAEYCGVLTWSNQQGDSKAEELPVRLSLSRTTPSGAINFDDTVHVRVPWGAEHTGGAPRFSVSGQLLSGAAPSRGLEVAEILVSSSTEVSGVLGRATPDANGNFEVRLGGGDRVDLFAAHVTRSGTVSAFEPVVHGEWVATLAGKVAGSPFENPHQAFAWGSAPEVLDPDHQGVELSGVTLGRADATSASTSARLSWREHVVPFASPSARKDHAMSYDARRGRVVMFGGVDDFGVLLSDTWEWNGDSWSRMTPARGFAPPAREGHAMTYHAASGYTLLFGGRGAAGDLGDTWLWDGERWLQVDTGEAAPSARNNHAFAYDSLRGVAVLFGGTDGAGLIDPALLGSSQTWEWNGSSWSEIATPVTPPAREGHSMAFDIEAGHVILVGGGAFGPPLFPGFPPDPTLLADRWSWDGQSWSELSPLPAPVRDFSVGYDTARDELIAFGGAGCDFSFDPSFCFPILAPGLLLSGETGEPLPALGVSPPARQLHAMAFDSARGKLVLFGGSLSEFGAPQSNDTWEWDSARQSWTNKSPVDAPAPSARDRHALAYLPESDRVVLFGGLSGGPVGATRTGDTWTFDGTQWQDLGAIAAPEARSGQRIAYDPGRGALLLFGGDSALGEPLDDLWSFQASALDPGQWQNLDPGSLAACDENALAPCGRQAHGLAHDGESLLIFSGGPTGAATAVGDFWSWDDGFERLGAAAESCDGDEAPCARGDHGWSCAAPASPGTTGECTLFGGTSASGRLGDTWTWNGTSWRRHAATGEQPLARSGGSLTLDTARHRHLLFGGLSSGGALDDSWEWDGQRWVDVTPLPGALRPPARADHASAYASSRGEGVLFGGIEQQVRFGDTWLWQAPDAPAHSVRVALEALAPAARFVAPGETPSPGAISLDAVRVAALSGGVGGANGTPGAAVRAWGALGWSARAAANSAAASSPGALCLEIGESEPGELLGARSGTALHFQLRPAARTGTGQPAQLTTDYVEVHVAYHLGEASPATRRGQSTHCP